MHITTLCQQCDSGLLRLWWLSDSLPPGMFDVLFLYFHLFRYTNGIMSQCPRVFTTVMLGTVDSYVCTFCDDHTATYIPEYVPTVNLHLRLETVEFCGISVFVWQVFIWNYGNIHAHIYVHMHLIHTVMTRCVETKKLLCLVSGAYTSPNYKGQESAPLFHTYPVTFRLEFRRN